MSRILVIQLERLGDLIQTTPLLMDLATSDNSTTIDLIVTSGLETVLPDLQYVTNVFTVPSEVVRSYSDGIDNAMRSKGLETIGKPILDALNLTEYDRIINVSHEHLSAWLTARIPARHREGAMIDTQGEWRYGGSAHSYLISMLDFREHNRFNLVDLYRTASASTVIPSPVARPQVAIDRSMALPQGEATVIALNPGASRAWKQWPASNFAALLGLLDLRGYRAVLVGGPADQALCDEIAALATVEVDNLSGQTNVPQMAGILESSALLVSNDTGAVHLAAAVGTSVVGLYGATHFAETAPWSAGNWLLQVPFSNESADWSDLTPELVADAIAVRCGQLDVREFRETLKNSTVEVWETAMLPPGADVLGGLYYVPIVARQRPFRALDHLLRHLLAYAFRDQPISRLEHDLSGLSAADCELLCDGLDASFGCLQALSDIAGQATRVCAARDPSLSDSLRHLTDQLSMNLDKLERITERYAILKPILHSLHWQLRMLPQTDPLAFFLEHMKLYHRTIEMLLVLANNLSCADSEK